MAAVDAEGSEFTLVVVSATGGRAIQLSGRAARMAALIAVYQAKINEMDVGIFEVAFAAKKLRPTLTQSLDISLDEWPREG